MELPNRILPRLREYDYSSENYYFVTVCTDRKKCLFGIVGNGLDRSEMKLSRYGKIAERELLNIQNHFPDVCVDKYAIMPNHIHAIIIIGCDASEAERSRPFPTVSTVIGLYKSGVSKRLHETEPDIEIWQKSFYDHVIRNEKAHRKIWQYIDENPLKWDLDCFSEH